MKEKKLMIIAAPKTASTSLLHDLCEITGLPGKQLFQPVQGVKLNFVNKRILRIQRYLTKLLGGKRLIAEHQPKLRDLYPATGYPFLRVLHSDVCDFQGVAEEDFQQIFPYNIHKQHLPPTAANIEIIKNISK